ncbi:hypothetical protein [Lewinella sp. JB7]|nr:hypothetical protein [Lewinella sp. JB7]
MKDCCKTDAPRGKIKKIINGVTTTVIVGLILAAIFLTLTRYLS